MPTFMSDYGITILKNGYEIVPIRPGKKFPDLEGWREIKATTSIVTKWIAGKFANYGIGVRTDYTPAVDSDCMDKVFQSEFMKRCQEEFGFAPIRFGQFPKFILVYRTEVPFDKILSPEYVDSQGRKAQLEILCRGQQFVAEHDHPDTKKPYRWPDAGGNLREWKHDDLCELTEAKAKRLREIWIEMAEARGWKVQKRTTQPERAVNGTGRTLTVADDPWDTENAPVQDIDDDRFAEMVMAIENDDRFDKRDDWYRFGMAIHHQTEGSDFGHDLWHQWSDQRGQGPGLVDKAWKSFGNGAEGRSMVTARFVLKLYNETHAEERGLVIEDIIDRMQKTTDVADLKSIAREATKIDADPLEKTAVLHALRAAYKRITHEILSMAEARMMVRYRRPAASAMPPWMKDWVYLYQPERFFNLKTKEMVTPKSFSLMHGRWVLKGDDPARYALDALNMPVKYMAAYAPTLPAEFTMDGHLYVNTYSEEGVPEIPETLTKRDTRNIIVVQDHLDHLMEDDRVIRLFTSYLAYIVQTKDRPNWCVVMQGVDGDGKSFFANLMAAVLGPRNVSSISAETALSTPHNTWAQGVMFLCVEELRISGQNRYQTIDKFKEPISNSVLSINPKGTPIYRSPNTQAYFFTTNHRDALPITDNDRRYFIILSRWQVGEKLKAFMREKPHYYDNLYNAVLESPGALRKWLLEYPLDKEFNPKGHAPLSHGRVEMIRTTQPESVSLIEELVKENLNERIRVDLIVSSAYAEAHLEEFKTQIVGHSLGFSLQRAGYTKLGRIKLDGKPEWIWARNPDEWMVKGVINSVKVREFLEKL